MGGVGAVKTKWLLRRKTRSNYCCEVYLLWFTPLPRDADGRRSKASDYSNTHRPGERRYSAAPYSPPIHSLRVCLPIALLSALVEADSFSQSSQNLDVISADLSAVLPMP